MTILDHISRFATDYRHRRRMRQTFRQVNALPIEIQKDIGWPGFMPESGSGRYARTRLG